MEDPVKIQVERLMTRESLMLKKRYILNNIDRLALEDRLAILRVISSIDRDRIKTLGTGTAYDLDRAPQGMLSVLCYTIEKLLKPIEA